MATKKAAAARDVDYPFPYFGQGSTRPIREKDGLVSLIVFQQPIASPVLASLAASAPGGLGAGVKPGALGVAHNIFNAAVTQRGGARHARSQRAA